MTQSTQETQPEQVQENTSPVQVVEAQNDEEVELEGPTFEYELNPMLRRFIAVNNTNDTYTVNMMIVPKTNDFPNFRVPQSSFQVTLRPNSTGTLLTIAKIFPEIDWAEYDIHYGVQKTEGSPTKLRSDEEQGQGKRAGFNIRRVGTSIDTLRLAGQKKCEVCKALNYSFDTFCRKCQSEL